MTSTIHWLLNPDDEDSEYLPLWCDLTSWWIAEYPDPEEEPWDGWLVAALSPDTIPLEALTALAVTIPLTRGWNFWYAGDREGLADLVVALADWTSAAIVIDLGEGGVEPITALTDDLRKDLAR